MKERIVIAMSGGVDSSIAAALLKEDGYDVIGVHMRIWNYLPQEEHSRFGSCCSLEDAADARRVADTLKIPFYVFNMEDEFSREVVDYFVTSYLHGRTPNPCIACNKKIKFDHLLKRIKKIGATKIATGHYAIIDTRDDGSPVLKRGVDKTKDQSYFLFNLSKEQLQNTLLPLGTYTKHDIRKMATSMHLPVAEKKDSQEICFIPDKDYATFIKQRVSTNTIQEGDIVDSSGKVLGKHKGTILYTIGQRKGLGIGSAHPLYVLQIDTEKNLVIVGGKSALERKECTVEDVNWLKNFSIGHPIKADVQIRYRHTASKATITPLTEKTVKILFHTPQKAITPGQAAVFYDTDTVIGGGWIQ